MKTIIVAVLFAILCLSFLSGCHNTGRQFRKMIDGIHDVLLEGSN